MTEKICRLCFGKYFRPFSIFGLKGMRLNVAKLIRMHFPDEVRTLKLSKAKGNYYSISVVVYRSALTTICRSPYVMTAGPNWKNSMNSTMRWRRRKTFS